MPEMCSADAAFTENIAICRAARSVQLLLPHMRRVARGRRRRDYASASRLRQRRVNQRKPRLEVHSQDATPAKYERQPPTVRPATSGLLARKIAVDFHDAHSLLAAGGASEHLSLVPEVTEIVIGRAPCWGRELSAIRAGRWSVICAKTTQSLLILHVSYPH